MPTAQHYCTHWHSFIAMQTMAMGSFLWMVHYTWLHLSHSWCMTVTGLPHAFHVTLIKQSLKTYKGRPVMTTDIKTYRRAPKLTICTMYRVRCICYDNKEYRIQSLPYKEGTELCCHAQWLMLCRTLDVDCSLFGTKMVTSLGLP